MSATKRIVVFGGNGFLGSRICRAAVARNWDVTSVSRSGTPHWSSVTSSATPPAWSSKVSWEHGDIFVPAQWTAFLKNANYVVHSLGILLEADYKGVLAGRESPIAGLAKAFDRTRGAHTPNPLERMRAHQDPVSPAAGQQQQLTYEMMNRDSTILLAKEAAAQGVEAFGFVSAAGGAPVLPSRYLSTKREAEAVVAREFPEMRGVFFRPPFMYDRSRKATIPLAAMVAAGSTFNTLTGGVLGGFLGAGGVKPLQADVVADAVVEGLADQSVKGPVEVKEIEELAHRTWRNTML
ncbi:NAD(P)-binding protein [Trichocladium antarcticum]|uniref:NAD(P)-binding protein n=1 Tax=Trichocladium antarcticum TaxID=1450529 RepID=A0AAN6ZG20_9PEZI|nr:NAD(P)-binding protein [Trichocladium antarcticum]